MQNIKNIEWGLFGNIKKLSKILSFEKKSKGRPCSIIRFCMQPEKGTTNIVQFARSNNSIWDNKNFVEISKTILVSSCGLGKRVTAIVASLVELALTF